MCRMTIAFLVLASGVAAASPSAPLDDQAMLEFFKPVLYFEDDGPDGHRIEYPISYVSDDTDIENNFASLPISYFAACYGQVHEQRDAAGKICWVVEYHFYYPRNWARFTLGFTFRGYSHEHDWEWLYVVVGSSDGLLRPYCASFSSHADNNQSLFSDAGRVRLFPGIVGGSVWRDDWARHPEEAPRVSRDATGRLEATVLASGNELDGSPEQGRDGAPITSFSILGVQFASSSCLSADTYYFGDPDLPSGCLICDGYADCASPRLPPWTRMGLGDQAPLPLDFRLPDDWDENASTEVLPARVAWTAGPTPSRDWLYFTFPPDARPDRLALMDIAGRRLRELSKLEPTVPCPSTCGGFPTGSIWRDSPSPVAPRRCSVWSFCADAGIAVLILGAAPGASSFEAGATGPPWRAPHEVVRAELGAASLIETGSVDEMTSARDRARVIATEARERLLAAGNSLPAALPDSIARGWIEIATVAYARALRQESVRLDRGGADDGTFRSVWNSMARTHLEILERWPRLWREEIGMQSSGGFLPAQLLLLCSPDAYAGESFTLPRESLFARMATLPESLAACCIDAGAIRLAQGASGTDQVAADIARHADLDALVGFRNGKRYWTLPADTPPRSRSNDAAVARVEAQAALEMLRACEAAERKPPGAGAEDAVPSALADVRAGGKLWPAQADPFCSVPGLRNPRRDHEGRLVCDLAISEECLAAMHPSARVRLVGRLAPNARLIALRPGLRE